MDAQEWYKTLSQARGAAPDCFNSSHFYDWYVKVCVKESSCVCDCSQCEPFRVKKPLPQPPRYCKIIGQFCHEGYGEGYADCKENHSECTGVY